MNTDCPECPLCGEVTDLPEGRPHDHCMDHEVFLSQVQGLGVSPSWEDER
jgi:hypothetical protein